LGTVSALSRRRSPATYIEGLRPGYCGAPVTRSRAESNVASASPS
jgi:hypothetical protein